MLHIIMLVSLHLKLVQQTAINASFKEKLIAITSNLQFHETNNFVLK